MAAAFAPVLNPCKPSVCPDRCTLRSGLAGSPHPGLERRCSAAPSAAQAWRQPRFAIQPAGAHRSRLLRCAAAASEGAAGAVEGAAPVASVEEAAGAEVEATDDPATAFDWQLGLALAGCAFEAYNDVDGEAPSLKMTSMGGTEITFVDEQFLCRKYAGLLELTVQRAAGLPVADWWPGAKSDPYAVVNIGISAAATRVVQQNLEPTWEETFFLFVSDPSKQRLAVRVLDADVGKADDLLGTAQRGLQDLADGQTHELELALRGPKGPAGSIYLRARFMPFEADGALAERAAARGMGGPVLGSPPQTIMTSQWRNLQREINAAADAMFDPVAYVDHAETDTQAWLFWNPEARSLCLAFRGTEQAKWKDILTDLSLVPASLDPEGVSDPAQQAWKRRRGEAASPAPNLERAVAALQSRRQEFRSSVMEGLRGLFLAQQGRQEEGEPVVWVHHGFLDAYASVRAEVLRLLEAALAGEEEPWTLYTTGHSLGAALSTLCTYDCARRSWRGAPPPRLVHYNYGSPRVGNKAFADEFDRLVPNTWRVANSNDAVTLVPRMLGYCHVGHKAALRGEGQLELTRNSSRGLGEGVEMANVALAAAVNLPALTEQLLARQEEEAAAAGDAGVSDSLLQQSKPALVSAAAAIANAASALAGAAAREEGTSVDDKEGAAAAAASAAAAAAAIAQAPTAAEVASLLEEEVRAMSALLDGSALSEHLEPLYLENLAAAIARARELQGQQGR